MPIDTSLIGQLRPTAQPATPFEIVGSLLKFQGLRQQIQAADDDARAKQHAQQKAVDEEKQLMGLYSSGQSPSVEALTAVVGPERAIALTRGFAAIQEIQAKQLTDQREATGRLALGIKALPPTLQEQFWPSIRETVIKAGLGNADQIPEQFTPAFLDATIAWAHGDQPQGAKPPAVGTFEDFVTEKYGPRPTPDQIVEGRKLYGQADDRPPTSVAEANDPTLQDSNRDLAKQLARGNLLPADLSKRGAYNQILSMANRISIEDTGKPLDVNRLKLDYQAAQKWVTSQNGPQMNRYRALADSVVNTIDEVQRLGDELKQGGVQLWNKVTRSTVREVYGNTPQSELANQYVAAVNTLKEEFANLANGGYAPTEPAWKLANEQINGDFGFKDLRASLTETQRLINFRTQAFNNLRPVTVPAKDAAPAPAGHGPAPTAGATSTRIVEQGGVRYRVTFDAAGKVITSEVIK